MHCYIYMRSLSLNGLSKPGCTEQDAYIHVEGVKDMAQEYAINKLVC